VRLYGAFLAGVGLCAPQEVRKEETMTSGKIDQAKGRIKEAAGALTKDKKLKREGKIDQRAGKVKEKFEEIVDEATDVFERDR